MPRPVDEGQHRVLVCQGSACVQRGGVEARHQWLLAAHEQPWVIVPTACLRFCLQAPVTVVYPEGVWLPRLSGERVQHAARALDRDGARDIAGGIEALAAPDPSF